MRKLTKIILPEVGVGNLKIRPRGDNRCESAKSMANYFQKRPPSELCTSCHFRLRPPVDSLLSFS